MNSGDLLHIFLPMRPAVLPDAQRLEAWALRSGVRARIELDVDDVNRSDGVVGRGETPTRPAARATHGRDLVELADHEIRFRGGPDCGGRLGRGGGG